MRELLLRYKKQIIIGIIICIFIIPFIIHVFFLISAPASFLRALWTAGDVLTFYGALIASGLMIFGVFLSIQYAQQQYREDVRCRALPYISISKLQTEYESPLLEQDTDDFFNNSYREYRLQKIYFIMKSGIITVKGGLTQVQQKLVDKGGSQIVSLLPGITSQVANKMLSIPLEVENNGNGAAVNLRIGLNQKKMKKGYLMPMNLVTTEKLYIHIFCEDLSQEDIGEYDFDFIYEDIYGQRYKQNFDLIITDESSDEKLRYGTRIALASTQIKLLEDESNEQTKI